MPQHSLEEAKLRLQEAFGIIETRIIELAKSDPHSSLHDRLAVARECIRDALKSVEHAEEAISGDAAKPCDGQP